MSGCFIPDLKRPSRMWETCRQWKGLAGSTGPEQRACSDPLPHVNRYCRSALKHNTFCHALSKQENGKMDWKLITSRSAFLDRTAAIRNGKQDWKGNGIAFRISGPLGCSPEPVAIHVYPQLRSEYQGEHQIELPGKAASTSGPRCVEIMNCRPTSPSISVD